MVTLTDLRAAQKINPSITIQQLVDKKKAGISVLTQNPDNILKAISAFKPTNKSMLQQYPKLKTMLGRSGASSTIAAIAKKIRAKDEESKYLTSIDHEARRLRAEIDASYDPKYHETSIDREARKLKAAIDPELKAHETSVDREAEKYR